ncbi:HAD-IIA family hydrolase [Cohnella sp. CFH 77786]|nr:HAD-IIA family hydrolase [Cohnella sp. CFH 77786]
MPAPRAILFDLDGTLYRGGERVPGADRLITRLADAGIPCWFVTNNSSRTPGEVAEHLVRLGIPAAPRQVVTSALAAADYAKRHHPGSRAFAIGEAGLREALAEAGIRILSEGDNGPADLVVQGIDREFHYGKLAAAVRHLLDGAAYILTNPDLLLPTDGGLRPGAGSLGAALRAASGIEPVVIGKPSSILMDYALERAGVRPEEAWVVGDNPATDIAAAVRVGCPSVLTLTGLCSAGDWEARCRSAGVFPDAVCAGLDELEFMLP